LKATTVIFGVRT